MERKAIRVSLDPLQAMADYYKAALAVGVAYDIALDRDPMPGIVACERVVSALAGTTVAATNGDTFSESPQTNMNSTVNIETTGGDVI